MSKTTCDHGPPIGPRVRPRNARKTSTTAVPDNSTLSPRWRIHQRTFDKVPSTGRFPSQAEAERRRSPTGAHVTGGNDDEKLLHYTLTPVGQLMGPTASIDPRAKNKHRIDNSTTDLGLRVGERRSPAATGTGLDRPAGCHLPSDRYRHRIGGRR